VRWVFIYPLGPSARNRWPRGGKRGGEEKERGHSLLFHPFVCNAIVKNPRGGPDTCRKRGFFPRTGKKGYAEEGGREKRRRKRIKPAGYFLREGPVKEGMLGEEKKERKKKRGEGEEKSPPLWAHPKFRGNGNKGEEKGKKGKKNGKKLDRHSYSSAVHRFKDSKERKGEKKGKKIRFLAAAPIFCF